MFKRILFILVLGIVLGQAFSLPNELSEFDLWILLFLIGIECSQNGEIIKKIQRYPREIFLLVVSILIGTSCGSIVASLITHMRIERGLLIGAGLGFYSLSSSMLSSSGDTKLAAISFIANFLRELGAILLCPELAKRNQNFPAAVASSASDTISPILAKYIDQDGLMITLISSIILTTLVPFLTSFLIQRG